MPVSAFRHYLAYTAPRSSRFPISYPSTHSCPSAPSQFFFCSCYHIMATFLPYATEKMDFEGEKMEVLSSQLEYCASNSDESLSKPMICRTSSRASKCRSIRKAMHNHKNPYARQNIPIFENSCPLCFFKHCRKILKNWLRKQKKPFSAVTVQIDRLTSEQYEENVSAPW